MKTATCKIVGISPLSFSKHVEVDKLPKELPKDYEKRTWREKLHYNNNGNVFIPGSMFKNCIAGAAKYLSMQIPGKGKSTYTKHFEAGVMCYEPAYIGLNKEDVQEEWLFVPSDGKRGGTTRVLKCFPKVPDGWETEIKFMIIDSTITEEVFTQHLEEAGRLIGIGRYRPRNNGFYGMFKVVNIQWSEDNAR
jgi:hypothetical protein